MDNIKYIGIRGHRGSGKNTVAYLLGNTIQWLLDNYMTKSGLNLKYASQLTQDSVFNISYRVWCDCIKKDETGSIEEMNTPNVYLESFGDSPRILLQLITNIPNTYFNSDYYKEHVVVNIKDFSWEIVDEPEQAVTFSSHEDLLSEIESREITEIDEEDVKLTLREMIIYFAKVCMKHLGRSVWVKSMQRSELYTYDDYYNIGQQFKIFRDIKAPSELTFVQEHGGVIIKVERPEFKKENKGVEVLGDDPRFDYVITINEDISTDEKLKHDLINLAIQLVQ